METFESLIEGFKFSCESKHRVPSGVFSPDRRENFIELWVIHPGINKLEGPRFKGSIYRCRDLNEAVIRQERLVEVSFRGREGRYPILIVQNSIQFNKHGIVISLSVGPSEVAPSGGEIMKI